MTRREIATFVSGALLGAALLIPASTVAQDAGAQKKAPQAPAAQGGCDSAPKAGCDSAPKAGCGETVKQACDEQAKAGCDTQAKAGCDTAAKAGCDTQAKASCDTSADDCATAGRPGEAHRKLDTMIGSWSAACTFWTKPGEAPQTSQGTSVNSWILGGRFVEQRFFGTMPGTNQAFEGHGFTGFDLAKGKYVGAWLDSYSTGISLSEGAVSPCGKVFSFRSEQVGAEGVMIKLRDELKLLSADRHVFTMWRAMGDGPEVKIMEIVYSRR
ncbi:MAG: DUF1579 family protein [Planctomycetota bacterium]|nr:DUF1579 family protein [Planctomycetota bacterium]